jgi:hypothetical protein
VGICVGGPKKFLASAGHMRDRTTKVTLETGV